jgi:hypothetical protein
VLMFVCTDTILLHGAQTYVRGLGAGLEIGLKRRVELLKGCSVSECFKLKLQGVINI